MPPKPDAEELAAQLADMRAELLETQRELQRANMQEKPDGVEAFIAAVSKVDIPSFWEADPVLWFRQCESAFRRAGTTSSGVKFDHIVGKLPNAVSLSCRSLLLSINFEDKDAYERLKTHLCKNYGKSKWQLGYALLDSPGLGDRRPSQLLQDLRALLPAEEAEGTIFQCIFLKRLPSPMSDAIMAADLVDIEAMAAMADRLYDRPSAPAITAVDSCCSHVSAIDSQQRKFNRSGRSPDRSTQSPVRRAATPGRKGGRGGRGGRGGASNSGRTGFREFVEQSRPKSQWVPGAKNSWCDKHKFFGDNAITCVPGCSFSEN
jgi:hypothetical protein